MKFKTIKGSTKLFEDNSYTFTPYGEGEPQEVQFLRSRLLVQSGK